MLPTCLNILHFDRTAEPRRNDKSWSSLSRTYTLTHVRTHTYDTRTHLYHMHTQDRDGDVIQLHPTTLF